jgi:CBS domain-containing protein
MKAADIMTSPVYTVAQDAKVAEAVRLMLQKHVSGLPVVDAAGKLVGMVTEGDFLRRSEIGTAKRRARWLELLLGPGAQAETYTHSHGRRVDEVMTREPVAIAENTPTTEIVRLMEKHRVKRLPVVRDGKPVGIVSRANLLHLFAGALADVKPVAASDAAIREHILAEMKTQSWAPTGSTNIIVRDGVVQLWGTIFDERERQALKVLAEGAPGAKGVEDHLIWLEPMSGLYLEPPKV